MIMTVDIVNSIIFENSYVMIHFLEGGRSRIVSLFISSKSVAVVQSVRVYSALRDTVPCLS